MKTLVHLDFYQKLQNVKLGNVVMLELKGSTKRGYVMRNENAVIVVHVKPLVFTKGDVIEGDGGIKSFRYADITGFIF